MYDLNEDGFVDMADRKFLVEHKSKLDTSLGDLNLNGEVDFPDYLTFTQELGTQNSDWGTGDFDGDGTTGLSDFLLLSEKFGKKRPDYPNSAPRETPWRNTALPEDVDGDRTVSAVDVVIIINRLIKLNVFGSSSAQLPERIDGTSPPPYVDTNGDGVLSSSDAVKVKEFLNPPQESCRAVGAVE
jgi:hypothetical protein